MGGGRSDVAHPVKAIRAGVVTATINAPPAVACRLRSFMHPFYTPKALTRNCAK